MARLLKVEVVLAFVENQVKNTKKKLEARGGLLAPVATSSSTPQPATWRCGMTTKVNVTALGRMPLRMLGSTPTATGPLKVLRAWCTS